MFSLQGLLQASQRGLLAYSPTACQDFAGANVRQEDRPHSAIPTGPSLACPVQTKREICGDRMTYRRRWILSALLLRQAGRQAQQVLASFLKSRAQTLPR